MSRKSFESLASTRETVSHTKPSGKSLLRATNSWKEVALRVVVPRFSGWRTPTESQRLTAPKVTGYPDWTTFLWTSLIVRPSSLTSWPENAQQLSAEYD